MRIALISPKGPLYRHRGGIFRKSLRYSPLTLITLAALVPADVPAEIAIYDEGIEDVPLDLEADLVAMTVITGSAPRAYALADHFRARGLPVVLGGPHITLIPEDAAPHATALVTGYAEHTWPQLLRDLQAGQMRPLYTQGAVDLAGQPWPRRDLLPQHLYRTSAVFEATRGCIHDCDFCVVPTAWGRKPYQRPVHEVAAEIQATGATKAIFIDLNLIADKAYARQLFDALTPLRIQWFGLATVLIERDLELLERMARSGCRGLLVGLESISQSNLDGASKRFNRADSYAAFVELLHRHGIALMGTFVFGLDGDGPEIFDETARFVVEAGIDLPRFAIATPFPNTPVFRRLEGEGRLLHKNWEMYDGQHVVFLPKQMSVGELQRGHERAWRAAYTATAITRRLARSRTELLITIPANLGYRYYATHLHTHYNCDWIVGQGAPRGLPGAGAA